MKTRLIFTALTLASALSASATEPIAPRDTVKVIDIEEVVVIATPKENTRLRQQAQSIYPRLWVEAHHLGLRAGHRFAHQYACRRIVCR